MRAARLASVLIGTLLFAFVVAPDAWAHDTTATATAPLTGSVTLAGKAAAKATVTASASGVNLTGTTDANGRFRLAAPVGTYDVVITLDTARAELRVVVPASGADITVSLTTVRKIGQTSVVAAPPVTGSGTDLNLTAAQLAKSPANGSLPALLLQLPGAARGANGSVHINGDHGDINYIVDGVQLPQELNRVIGTEIDPNDLSTVDVLQGAYPAQYGERFASVLDVTTKTGGGPPGFGADVYGGTFDTLHGDFDYHTTIGKTSLIFASDNASTDRGLDPPNPQSPHNSSSDDNQFFRLAAPVGTDFINVTFSHSYQTFQIPDDVDGGEPATTDDSETQDDLFTTVQYRHPIGDHGLLSFGPFYKQSTIRDFGDPANDFTYGEAINAAAGGGSSDCANALTLTNPTIANGVVTGGFAPNPGLVNPAGYSTTTCGFSLTDTRTAVDLGGNLDYDNKSAHHDVKFGVYYDASHVSKDYDITLQPGNFLAPIFTPATPDAPYTVVDDTPNVGHLTAFYLQDSWKFEANDQVDYGVREDIFLVNSTDFGVGYSQASPRLKYTHFFGRNHADSVYVFYGRFFTPFSLENVGPVAAYTLNLPTGLPLAGFDLKPQRDSDYEFGGHFALKRGDIGYRVMQKNATDLIDDTQVGDTNLHQDINYALGRIATQTAYYQLPLTRASRYYASVTHTYSVVKGCETQLLAPCFPAVVNGAQDWTPADHDQRIDATSGIVVNDRIGGWYGIDGEYGSGLSSALNPTGGITCAGYLLEEPIGGPCKRTPHLTFDAEKGFAVGPNTALTLRIINLLNDEYLVTYENAQGNHWAQPRTVELGFRINSP
jgi:hypothetical protein